LVDIGGMFSTTITIFPFITTFGKPLLRTFIGIIIKGNIGRYRRMFSTIIYKYIFMKSFGKPLLRTFIGIIIKE
jgi:hypothetical protein